MKAEQKMQASLFVSSLPKTWDTLVVPLHNPTPKRTLSYYKYYQWYPSERRSSTKGMGLEFYSKANIIHRRGRDATCGYNRSKYQNESQRRSKFF